MAKFPNLQTLVPPKIPAFSSPEVRVVEASAGSGKTYALTKRYVQLLLNPKLRLEHISIRNILAITFTNKAAFEMKSRILDVLKQLALEQLQPQQLAEFLDPIRVDAKAASQKAFQVMETIIHNYNFFQVQTIDKFINALLSGCAFKIGLTANFRIKTNSFEYLERSLDELIDRIPRDKNLAKIFETFIHHYLYLENRTGWFPKEDILIIMKHLFAQHNIYGVSFQQSSAQAKDLIQKKQIIREQMKKLKDALPDSADKRFLASLDKFLLNNSQAFDIDSVPDYFGRSEVPVCKNGEVPGRAQDLWQGITGNLRELCQAEAHSLFNPYVAIFEEVMRRFYRLTSQDDILFLEELNKRAGLLFDKDYVTVEELYYRLATRFHHYLVDEFQDTSRLQWHNFEKMTEEALSTGGTLFYVGDRKQAIYSFRGGDIGLFEDVKSEFASFNVQTEVLTNNWRSQRSIVEFNNRIFSVENLKRFLAKKEEYQEEKNSRRVVSFTEEDWRVVESIYGNARQSWQTGNNGGYVKTEFIDSEIKEERNKVIRQKIVSQIHELRKRFSCRDIAILTRDNSEIEEVTDWLLDENIPVDSERTSNIKEHPLIQELVALLKFLNSPIDNLSFVNFILGEFFAKTTGLLPQELHHFVFSQRNRLKREKDFYIYTAFREVYADIWQQYFEEFFKNIGLFPLYELLVSIYHRFSCLEHFPDAQGFLMHFLELVKQNEEEHADVESFINYFEKLEGEDLYVQMTDVDAIRLLTIHKSKGLEFPIVILPFLGMEVQVGASRDAMQSYILKREENGMELLRFKSKYTKFSPELWDLYEREYKKVFLAELNNMYVALTRARHEMYIFMPKKTGNNINLAQFFIPQELYVQGAIQNYPLKSDKDIPGMKLSVSRYYDWLEYLKDEFLDVAQLKYRQQRVKGEIIHYLLSHFGDLSTENAEKVLERAAEAAKTHFLEVRDFSPYQDTVRKIITAEELKGFFELSGAQVFTEKEIITQRGETRRIDRLIIREKEIWVVDYKTAADPQANYQAQVQEYMRLVGDLYPQYCIKGFLFYWDELSIEEIV